ncbi:NAD-dependent succinate-semialdehyde dehydrogenase [Dasania sp. GY-MA-18]|uniref:NAD-dependent succinate-semialdehyde dehydrogenase n=1 Tax=Dasania phycosphaerae TaxID=2950436 RepID=A0A9J6RRY3_9GAMM|nr:MULTISPECIES: NAD-dependent succinate-semialdehyde dehydrogenase [Dasania]MCR8924275.1 NAD-dependent succinate-semialdehyde dehydrogenase [Dasania sp. GY-MA-18]MCZ0866928.1 NAD-dependent succinate-semialdehyde dehydrogenase [Dasania phycosphaerae]MCZ0870432.1 NAD-dependent succinate-semialdehyde dehydrogenase [Dasania phycosphaerae]
MNSSIGTGLNKPLVKSGSYINGCWLASGEQRLAVTNPATGELLTNLSSATAADAEDAVAAATAALPAWREMPAKARAQLLRRWFDLIIENKKQLAEILSAEQGKPLAEAESEVVYGAASIEWFAEEAKRVYGDIIPAPSGDKRLVVIKQPVGVVSAITPWNFPSAMITRKAAPALAAGCSFIVKASEETPLSALALAALSQQAGIPAGVFNVLVSQRAVEIGEVLTRDSRIHKFSFTGSTAVGKLLLKQCADTVKKTSMELGGNAPFIVFKDADIDAAVKGLLYSKFRNAGQTCVCTNRVLVQSEVYERFIAKLVPAVRALKMGAGDDASTQIGPLINERAVLSVAQKVNHALAMGAKLLTGGCKSSLGDCFYTPTVLANVTPAMEVFNSEIFGPVLPVIKFDTEQQAIDLANNTQAGLASYIYSRDIGRIWRLAEALEYGMVGINDAEISNEVAPFGGVKESGMGREGSKYGIEDYLEIKYLCMGGLNN